MTRTLQERVIIQAMRDEHVRLSRAPTMRELKQALAVTPLAPLSHDRFRQVLQRFNARRPEGAPALLLTSDRAFFREHKIVERAFRACKDQLGEAPTAGELKRFLIETNTTISPTSLSNILKDLRGRAAETGESFSLNRRRLSISYREVRGAYDQALTYLQDLGIRKLPTVALIRDFLAKGGKVVDCGALRYRLQKAPPTLGFRISRHFDPTDLILRSCTKRLQRTLLRNPTVKELTRAFNAVAFTRMTPDAVWMRVQRINANPKRPSCQRITLVQSRASGIYNSDIERVLEQERARRQRQPTIQELQSALLEAVPGSRIAIDGLYRRVRKMRLSLSREYDITRNEQGAVTSEIIALRERFGRKPFSFEVLEALQNKGVSITYSSMCRILSSAKRYKTEAFKAQVCLGLPQHQLGKISQVYSDLRRTAPGFPSAEDLRGRLGWTWEGFERALPLAQDRAAERGLRPIIVAGTAVAGALDMLAGRIRGVLALRSASHAEVCGQNEEAAIQILARGWSLPELSGLPERLPLDEVLLRLEMWWVILVSLHAPPQPLDEDLEIKGRIIEYEWAKGCGADPGETNPFRGIGHALVAANAVGRVSDQRLEELKNLGRDVRELPELFRVLRNEVRELAEQCDFPTRIRRRRARASRDS